MTPATTGLAQSVHTRLVAHAKSLGADPNLVLRRYATERLLYRLSRSRFAEQFVLKGGLLLLAWLGETTRPTRDADLLGLEQLGDDALLALFGEVCEVAVEPDGVRFDADSLRVTGIRPDDAHGGRRVTRAARMGNSRLNVQVDVGFGDAVTPAPAWLDYPSLLELPRPRLRAYAAETVIAEKVHAMVELGTRNSRMRDFFDVDILAARKSFRGERLVRALRATFKRRQTEIPAVLPSLLEPGSAAVSEKAVQWNAFLRKSGLVADSREFDLVVRSVAGFLEPAIRAAREGGPFDAEWVAGGPWQ